MSFHFATAGEIVFSAGCVQKLPEMAAQYAKRVFLITGGNPGRYRQLIDAVNMRSEMLVYPVSTEPTIEMVTDAAGQARAFSAGLVIGIGGGSVLDAGKAVSALLTNDGDLMQYLEVVGLSQPIRKKPCPYIAVPTTAGTGAEVTKNAVITSVGHRVKVSMRHQWMIPDHAVIDPELTFSMPPELTASTGLDALTQLIEPFVTSYHNPLTDALCREGLIRASRSLKTAYDHGADPGAREDMAVASLFGGLALANAKLGAVHGIAGPLGGRFSVSHGIVCARLLAPVLRSNIQVLRGDEKHPGRLERFRELAGIVTGVPDADAEESVIWIESLCRHMKIPPLSSQGIRRNDFPFIIDQSLKSSSMAGNPVKLSRKDLTEILENAVFS
ncbi:iron-containing alcohol dehydrogenase [bacterium]|nr:iron-containing alcohol dehydrogenase [bacterium]